MSQKLEMLLREWGAFNLAHLDHANEYGSNVLYAAGLIGGRVQDKGDGHKVLDVDTPLRLRRVDHAMHRIHPDAALAIKIFYCCPLKEDGLKFTRRELASLMSLSERSFYELVKQGRRELDMFMVM